MTTLAFARTHFHPMLRLCWNVVWLLLCRIQLSLCTCWFDWWGPFRYSHPCHFLCPLCCILQKGGSFFPFPPSPFEHYIPVFHWVWSLASLLSVILTSSSSPDLRLSPFPAPSTWEYLAEERFKLGALPLKYDWGIWQVWREFLWAQCTVVCTSFIPG